MWYFVRRWPNQLLERYLRLYAQGLRPRGTAQKVVYKHAGMVCTHRIRHLMLYTSLSGVVHTSTYCKRRSRSSYRVPLSHGFGIPDIVSRTVNKAAVYVLNGGHQTI